MDYVSMVKATIEVNSRGYTVTHAECRLRDGTVITVVRMRPGAERDRHGIPKARAVIRVTDDGRWSVTYIR